MSAVYRLTADDPHFGLNKGDLLLCIPYAYDPRTKVTVVRRITDGFDPSCTQYLHDVERITDDELMDDLYVMRYGEQLP